MTTSPLAASLLDSIRSRRARTGVIGLGYVGLPLAVEFARGGYTTTGIDLDEAANTAGGPCISRRSSRVSAWCIPTQPDLLIARHTRALVGLSS